MISFFFHKTGCQDSAERNDNQSGKFHNYKFKALEIFLISLSAGISHQYIWV
jgi:hypothetical protein